MKTFFPYIFFLISVVANAQELKWYDVTGMKLEGQPMGPATNSFQRFPDSMKDSVRDWVWELSENPAGINLNFITNASEIKVSYVIEGEMEFSHMPATGVSGIDLYLKNKDQNWLWAKGNYNFADTITYNFKISPVFDPDESNNYKLYLPLYAKVKWMKLGIDKAATFEVLPLTEELPVIVYGTSITQGLVLGGLVQRGLPDYPGIFKGRF